MITFLISLGLFLGLSTPLLAASSSLDLTYIYDLTDKDTQDGDLLSNIAGQGIKRSMTSYDSHLFGVVQVNPIVVYRRIDNTGIPVARNGIALVNVTTVNGPIAPGDYITSSELAGKGKKADQSGYVIGVAVEGFTEKDGSQVEVKVTPNSTVTTKVAVGKIKVALRIEYAEISTTRFINRLFDYFNVALFKNIQDPNKFVQTLRYIAAALTVLISLVIGFFSFSRALPKGVEAIGRNPLAQRAIILSLLLNIGFTLAVIAIGVIAALFILRL